MQNWRSRPVPRPSRRPSNRARAAVALFLALALIIVAAPAAHAELVGEFYARLKNVTTWGAYTAVLESRIYETDGSPPPDLDAAEIHFPRGAAIRDRFLNHRFYCDPELLARTLDPKVCRHAQFGRGEILMDARPWIADPVHADIIFYLGEAEEPGAVASAIVLVTSNQRSHAYDFQVLHGTLRRERGRFGYRLELPTRIRPILPQVKLRLAELTLTVRGLRTVERSRRCVKRSGGRCTARRTVSKPVFWTRTPACPRARKLSFGADYAFVGEDAVRKRRRLDCRRFLRRPSAHRRGRIPGAP
jgi:hypothetical protein